jgi:hypothetical protein
VSHPDTTTTGFTPVNERHSPKGPSNPVEKVYSRSQQRELPHWQHTNGTSISIDSPAPALNGPPIKRRYIELDSPSEDNRQHDRTPITSPNGAASNREYITQVDGRNGHHHPSSSWGSATEDSRMIDILRPEHEMRSDSVMNGVPLPESISTAPPLLASGQDVAPITNVGLRSEMGKRKRVSTLEHVTSPLSFND